MNPHSISTRRFELTGLALTLLFGAAVPAAAQVTDGSPEPNPKVKSKPGVPDGYRLVHGDILVPDAEARGGSVPVPWTDGIVYYEFDANVSTTNRRLMLEAMDEWNYSGADVTFVPRTVGLDDDFFIHIQDSDRNSSMIGMRSAGQVLNMINWGSKFIMVHELCHALGYWHEQSRPDRDIFVDIITENIESDHVFNFDMEPNWLAQLTPYDYDSVMHYGQFAFTKCDIPTPVLCETIICRVPYQGWQWLIGQRGHLSERDIEDMQNEYGVDTIGPLYIDRTSTSSTEAGSLRHPYKTFVLAEANAPSNSDRWIRGGTYDEVGIVRLDNPGVYRAHTGVVRIQ
jgi:hypothetical protein